MRDAHGLHPLDAVAGARFVRYHPSMKSTTSRRYRIPHSVRSMTWDLWRSQDVAKRRALERWENEGGRIVRRDQLEPLDKTAQPAVVRSAP